MSLLLLLRGVGPAKFPMIRVGGGRRRLDELRRAQELEAQAEIQRKKDRAIALAAIIEFDDTAPPITLLLNHP